MPAWGNGRDLNIQLPHLKINNGKEMEKKEMNLMLNDHDITNVLRFCSLLINIFFSYSKNGYKLCQKKYIGSVVWR